MTKKSGTEIINLDGLVKWAKLFEPDEFRGATRWTLNLYPDEASMAKFKKSGMQVVPKKDDDGEYINLRRPVSKLIKNDLVFFTPPFIYDADGQPLVTYKDKEGKNLYSYSKGDEVVTDGNKILIGNLSKIRTRVAVFNTAMGKGHRLESVRILDLIEYNPDSLTDNEVDGEEVDQVKEVKKAETKQSNLPW